MKKTKLLNSKISRVISEMGHTDSLVIADCGLPIDNSVERIDLALTSNTPSFLETLKIVLEELEVESVIIAKEMNNEKSKNIYDEIKKLFKDKIKEVTHQEFKKLTKESKAVIRTGEMTPYANIILKSGVVF